MVRLLRAGEDAARLARARVRGDLARRRSGLPAAAARPDRRLDRAPDPGRRPADRRLHRALAARPQRRPRAARGLARQLLTGRAVPRAAASGAHLLDRRPAALTRLARAAIDLELVLHPPARAAWGAVVAERCPLARDPGPECRPDAAMERRDLSLGQLAGRPLRM